MAAPLEQILADVTRCLENHSVPYFIFGAVAAGLWGEPRYTLDIDLVVRLKEEEFGGMIEGLRAEGLEVDPAAPAVLRRSGMLRVRGYGVAADLVLGETEFDREALGRRRREFLFGIPVYIASPEDTILYKLISHRYQDLADIEKIVLRQGSRLDLPYLRRWAAWLSDETGFENLTGLLEQLLVSGGYK
jgi:hypothetical protein